MKTQTMTNESMAEVARRHCAAHRPALNFRGFLREIYGVSTQFFQDAAEGRRGPGVKLLQNMSQAHVRLFPTEPVVLCVPNHPPVLLGRNSAEPRRPKPPRAQASGVQRAPGRKRAAILTNHKKRK